MIDINEFLESCKPYQGIIDKVTIDEMICVAMGTPIHCNYEEMIVKAIVQRLWKSEQMEAQWIDDMDNPLEPIKLSSALRSEILKYEFRKANKPKDISPLDITVIMALKHCLDEQTKGEKQ